MISLRMAAGVMSLGAIAACGGTAMNASSPKDVLLTAARLTTSESFRIQLAATETFSASGPASSQLGALSAQPIEVMATLDVKDRNNFISHLTTAVAGRNIDVQVVAFGGSLFVSTNSGVSYQSAPNVGIPQSQYGPDSALQYLQSVGNVSDTGAGTSNGVGVEKYHAQLDQAKITSVIKSALASLKSPLFDKVLSTMQFTGGSLDAAVDHAGRLVTDSGVIDVSMDLGAIDATYSGTALQLHETVSSHFYDYGAPITVSRPSNVTGSVALP